MRIPSGASFSGRCIMFWIKEESSALVRIRFVRWNFWISGRFPRLSTMLRSISSGEITSSESLEKITGLCSLHVSRTDNFPGTEDVLHLPECCCNSQDPSFRPAEYLPENLSAADVHEESSILSRLSTVNDTDSLAHGQLHRNIIKQQCFPVPGSPLNQKYPPLSPRILFRICRSISLCWEVRKYSF